MARDDSSVQQLAMQDGHARKYLAAVRNIEVILSLIVLFQQQHNMAYEFYFQTSSQAYPA
jgi:hypothetical protein